ncbi:MAG: hypothetical protein M1827_007419 [Pycnora praestabilis]|nr:MAG: hypothetical protein M1827_007419 [Pycnora praestabilis]
MTKPKLKDSPAAKLLAWAKKEGKVQDKARARTPQWLPPNPGAHIDVPLYHYNLPAYPKESEIKPDPKDDALDLNPFVQRATTTRDLQRDINLQQAQEKLGIDGAEWLRLQQDVKNFISRPNDSRDRSDQEALMTATAFLESGGAVKMADKFFGFLGEAVTDLILVNRGGLVWGVDDTMQVSPELVTTIIECVAAIVVSKKTKLECSPVNEESLDSKVQRKPMRSSFCVSDLLPHDVLADSGWKEEASQSIDVDKSLLVPEDAEDNTTLYDRETPDFEDRHQILEMSVNGAERSKKRAAPESENEAHRPYKSIHFVTNSLSQTESTLKDHDVVSSMKVGSPQELKHNTPHSSSHIRTRSSATLEDSSLEPPLVWLKATLYQDYVRMAATKLLKLSECETLPHLMLQIKQSFRDLLHDNNKTVGDIRALRIHLGQGSDLKDEEIWEIGVDEKDQWEFVIQCVGERGRKEGQRVGVVGSALEVHFLS